MAGFDWRKPAIAVTLLGAAVLSWWLPRAVTPPTVVPVTEPRHEPDYTAEHFTAVTLNEAGRRLYQLSADRLVHFADDGSADLERPYLIQYREGMAPTHYRARQGWIPGDGSHIVLTGDVHVARGRDPQGAAADIRSDTMRVELEKPATQRPRHAKP